MSSLIRAVSRSGLFRNLNLNISELTEQNMASSIMKRRWPSYFSSGEKNNVVIYYPYRDPNGNTFSAKIIFASYGKKFPSFSEEEEPLTKKLSSSFVIPTMGCIRTTNNAEEPCLHFFGCIGESAEPREPRIRVDETSLTEVYRYDLYGKPKKEIQLCKSKITGISSVLSVQVDGFIYLLGYPSSKLDHNEAYRPLFQRYNFKQDTLESVGGDLSILNLRRTDNYDVRLHINQAPHVVIGRKIHVSLGDHSCTFDTSTSIWEESKLFKSFWSDQEKNGLSPSNFYGKPICFDHRPWVTDNPFGFEGRGILLDQNIFLGVYCTATSPLVAFYLKDDEKGDRVVVKSQRITLRELGLADYNYISSGRLVDIGRDGCICFAYVSPYGGYFSYFGSIEVKLIKFSQLGGDSDDILKCEVVGTKSVLHNVVCSTADEYFDAFRA